MVNQPRRNFDKVKKRFNTGLENLRAAAHELDALDLPESADEARKLAGLVTIWVKDKGWLYYLEHGQDWDQKPPEHVAGERIEVAN